MFILFESIPSDDPRWSNIQRVNHYWFHEVGFIDPLNQSQVNLLALNAVEITEDVAMAVRFAKINWLANNGGIKFRIQDGGVDDLFLDTSLDEGDPRAKVMYKLTEADQQNTLEFLKTVMTMELNNHYRQLTDIERDKFPNKRALILQEIKNCQDILDAHRLMHCRFGTEVHNHQREAEQLGYPEWDLSTPGLEIRSGVRRVVDRPQIVSPQ